MLTAAVVFRVVHLPLRWCCSTSVDPALMPLTRPVNTTALPTLTALWLAETVIEPMAVSVRDGFMLGMPVWVVVGLAAGIPVAAAVAVPVDSSAADRAPAASARVGGFG